MTSGLGHVWADWLVTILVTLAAILQLANARLPTDVALVASGRALLAGGWILGAIWFWFRIIDLDGDLPLPPPALTWTGLVALGTICVCLYRIDNEVVRAPRAVECD